MLPAPPAASRDLFSAPIEDVFPNRDQPRSSFDEEGINGLAASIREVGILEPILVRKRSAGGFEIIAGERRWRAAQRAGLKAVPVFVRDLSRLEAFEAALVENLQREDLNPIETARAFQRLVEEHAHTQESIATRLGKDRSTIANAMRLLKLPPEVIELVQTGRLTEGHGRAILGAPDVQTMLRLARAAAEQRMSVRETERRSRAAAKRSRGVKDKPPARSANVRDLEVRLSRSLGTPVRVVDKKGKGRLEVAYSSYDELDRLIARLT